ncbi:hypothetical protein N2488_04200 [SAR92 clade bacterium H231]|nr:hypothetical protein [SAR92 clade bacterium H231]
MTNECNKSIRQSVDVYFFEETVIDQPVEKVWPHLLNIKGWLNDYGTERLSGEEGKVGLLVKVMPPGIGDEVPLPHNHLYRLATVIPNKLITLKVFSEEGGSYGMDYTNIDNMLLTEVDGKTKISFIGGMEIRRHGMSEKEIQEYAKVIEDSVPVRFEKFWVNLKRLVERNNN